MWLSTSHEPPKLLCRQKTQSLLLLREKARGREKKFYLPPHLTRSPKGARGIARSHLKIIFRRKIPRRESSNPMSVQEETHISFKVAVRDGKSCEKILKIEVPEAEIRREYDEYYDAISPKAKVPGFRPGKAPRNVLALHYGQDAKESVLKHLISESYRLAVRQKSLEPIGLPDIGEVQFDERKLSYEARVEVRPKIKLSKVSGLYAKKEKPEIREEEVNQTLERIREALAQYKAVEDRAVALGDFVIADYTCTVDGKVLEKKADEWFQIQEEEFLKGFSPQIVGAAAGEDRRIEVTFPENTARKEMAGKKAAFQIKIKEIKTKLVPAVDDELARQAGEHKSLEELKEKIRQDILARKESDLETRYEKALLDELVKHNKMDIPQGFLARRHERMIHEVMSNSGRRHSHEPHDKPEETQEKLRKELEPEARRQVHLAFLLDQIAIEQNFTAGEEDFRAKFAEIASEMRRSAEEVEKYYREHEDALESLAEQIRSQKALQYVKENAKKD